MRQKENEIPPPKTPSCSATPNKRFVKGKRLEHSIEISRELLRIEEEKKNAIISCHKEKKKYLIWRKEYEREKLKCLRNSVEIQENILREIRNIKEIFL